MNEVKTKEIKQMGGAIFIMLLVLILASQKIQAMDVNGSNIPIKKEKSRFIEKDKHNYDLPTLFKIDR